MYGWDAVVCEMLIYNYTTYESLWKLYNNLVNNKLAMLSSLESLIMTLMFGNCYNELATYSIVSE